MAGVHLSVRSHAEESSCICHVVGGGTSFNCLTTLLRFFP